LCARNEEELENARTELVGLGAGVLTVSCDLRDQESVEDAVARALAHYGQIDALVNNAGTIRVGPVESMTLEDYKEQMDSNFWSAVYATNAVLPGMRRLRSGRIVNISSIGGKIGVPHLLPYSASKFALAGYSRALRAEVAKDGIVVTTIYPGLMRTGSPRHGYFKDQNEKEYAWFSIADSLPVISMSAEHAARDIVSAAARGEVETVLGMPAKLAVLFDQVLPEVSGELMSVAARFMPAPTGRTGYAIPGSESQSAASPSVLTAPTEQAARRNNEMIPT
jgi:short-subunit dehydrogenase